jgi:hypothetical protein
MASAVRTHRPHIEVVAAGLATLGEEVRRFDPHLVICSQPNTVEPGSSPAWVELPPNPERLAEVCIDGQSFEAAARGIASHERNSTNVQATVPGMCAGKKRTIAA